MKISIEIMSKSLGLLVVFGITIKEYRLFRLTRMRFDKKKYYFLDIFDKRVYKTRKSK